MHAENLVIDQGSDGHAVEHVLELLPDSDAVAALALIVESVNTVDLSALVVTSEQEEVLLEFDFVGQEQNDGLKGLLATVDVITQEEVVGIRRESAVLKQSQQISKLPVNITYDQYKIRNLLA